MDRRRDGVTFLGDSAHNGLKQMLPECFVSVKLETYEEGSGSEIQEYPAAKISVTPDGTSESNFVSTHHSTSQETNCLQPSLNCNSRPLKQLCIVPSSASSASPHSIYQVQIATPIMQQNQSGNQSQSAQQQPAQPQAPQISHTTEVPHVSQADGSINRPPPQPSTPASLPSSHSFNHTHTRPSEIAWLSHTYVDQGTQHFHAHHMPYLPNDAAMLTSMPHPQIQTHEGSRAVKHVTGSRNGPTTVSCGSENNSPSITSVSASETGDSNAFIGYVLNPQRGASSPGIFLLDASRGLTAQTSHQVQDGSTTDEVQNVDRSASVPLSESGSILGSPKPGESHLVSRSCQTVVTMSQIQDAPLMPDGKIMLTHTPAPDLETEPEDSKERVFAEADCEDSEEVSSMVSDCDSENLKHVTGVSSTCSDFQRQTDFSHQQATQNCQGQANCVSAAVNVKCIVEQSSGCVGISKRSGIQGDPAQHKTETSLNPKNGINENVGSTNFQYLENYKPFRCDVCGKTYPSQQALINHERYHRGERPYECETCHKAFATNSHLVTHRRTHTGERPFQCQLCQRRFADRSAFVKHERTHGPNGSVIKRYKCDECGSGFVDSCGLKKHIRIHTGERPYVCNVCEKTFSTSSTFVAHKRIHTGERPYKCESCDKMFITKSHLLTHRRTHTGEKPFTCSVCNRCFADGSSFRRHERLHTGENRHICMQCGRGFPLESSLEKHKQTHVQTSSYSYVYENRSDLSCLASQQQQQNCDLQGSRSARVPVPQVRDTSDRNVCFDLSREITGEVQVNRNSGCAVASREIGCDSQTPHPTVMVTAREVA